MNTSVSHQLLTYSDSPFIHPFTHPFIHPHSIPHLHSITPSLHSPSYASTNLSPSTTILHVYITKRINISYAYKAQLISIPHVYVTKSINSTTNLHPTYQVHGTRGWATYGGHRHKRHSVPCGGCTTHLLGKHDTIVPYSRINYRISGENMYMP